MTILLPAVAAAFAAFCVWLAVRIVNRRERWAKWTAVAVVATLPILYLASFGPACWWIAKTVPESPGGPRVGSNAAYVSKAYWPIGWAVERYPSIRPMIARYSRLFGARTAVLVPSKGTGAEGSFYGFSRNDRPQEIRHDILGDQMTIVLSAVSVAFAAFCVWLTVRIVVWPKVLSPRFSF